MIIGLIELKRNNEIKISSKVECKCECCYKNFNRIYSNAIKDSRFCKSCTIINMNKTRDPNIHKLMILNASKKCKGNTLEYICGIEKSIKIKKQQSLRTSGKNNPNFGGKYSRGFKDRPLTGPIELRYGKEKSDRMKKQFSKNASGKNNPMYGKSTPVGSGNGISGWWKQKLYFKSLLELAFILKCEKENKIIFSAEKKEFRFTYNIDGKSRTYVPDFVDENGTLYELKPKKLLNSYQVKLKIEVAPSVIILTEDDVTRPTKEELYKLICDGMVIIDPSKIKRII